MRSPTEHFPPKVEQGGSVRIITFPADPIRDVENVIARELQDRTGGMGEGHLLLDFTNVEYITSVELGTLVRLHKEVKARGGRLTLFNLKAEVYEVFTTTRLQTFMGICREEGPEPPGAPEG
jgi:anti-anti-sigma factor